MTINFSGSYMAEVRETLGTKTHTLWLTIREGQCNIYKRAIFFFINGGISEGDPTGGKTKFKMKIK